MVVSKVLKYQILMEEKIKQNHRNENERNRLFLFYFLPLKFFLTSNLKSFAMSALEFSISSF